MNMTRTLLLPRLHQHLQDTADQVNTLLAWSSTYPSQMGFPTAETFRYGREPAEIPTHLHPFATDLVVRALGGMINHFHEQDPHIGSPLITVDPLVLDEEDCLRVVVNLDWTIGGERQVTRHLLTLPLYPTLQLRNPENAADGWLACPTSRTDYRFNCCLMEIGYLLCLYLPSTLVDNVSKSIFSNWMNEHRIQDLISG